MSARRRAAAVLSALSVSASALIAASPAASAQTADPRGLHCSDYTLPVAIADPGPADQTLWGELCYRGPVAPAAVQLLVHGATYTHLYWNFPYGDGYYSYVDAATAAGYATFDVDRIGAGASSRPLSAALSLAANAVSLHDAITALRSGAVGGHAFRQVVWVGHSLGSIIGWLEGSQYHDVNSMILTGATHLLDLAALPVFTADIQPADLQAGPFAGLDPGYLTTAPGTRKTLFYAADTADPDVVALDEATKGTVTAPEFTDALTLLSTSSLLQPSLRIDVPVLLVLGQDDALFCVGATAYSCTDPASVRRYESRFYSPAARLRLVTVPYTGHDLALSATAPVTDAIMLAWSESVAAP